MNDMARRIRVGKYAFDLAEIGYGTTRYECRGERCWDDEHDECPEEGLWIATKKLAEDLSKQGYDAEPSYSEKGWCEVYINEG